MLTFLAQNIGSIIVGLLVVAVVLAIVVKQIKNIKSGKGSCGCGCESCGGACHRSETAR